MIMKRLNLLKQIAILLLIVSISCKNQPEKVKNGNQENSELKGTISISGAFALYPMTARWAEEFQKIHPKVRIDISAGGAGKGMTDALSGIVDLGMFSRGITDVEKAKGVWWIAVTQDAVLPTMNASNQILENVKEIGFTKDDFTACFLTREIKTWEKWSKGDAEGNNTINVYTRSDACGAAQMWGEYLGKNQEDLIGIGIYGDPGMADAVKNDKQGIGYNNVIYIYDINTRKKHAGLEVIPIDLNENGKVDDDEKLYDSLDMIMKAIKDGKYPSPPARDLYFVSKGKPSKRIVVEFLKWIITDGQKYVNEAGYVQLSEDNLNAGLKSFE